MAVTNLYSSSIQLRRHTESANFAPPSLLEGEFAINLIDGHLYYGNKGATSVLSNFTLTNLIISESVTITGSLDVEAENVNITGNLNVLGTGSFDVLITNYESSSIIYSSGSTKFGDTLDDTHEFTGSVFISGSSFNIDDSLTYNADSSPTSLFVDGDITSSANISASGYISSSGLIVKGTISASAYEGISPAQYTTKSAVDDPSFPKNDLLTYRVVNYNPEIFVTASGTEFIIQFGEPLTPTNLVGTINTDFNLDRFSGPGVGSYVVDTYTVTFTYTLDASNTFSSASLLTMSADNTPIELSASLAGDSTTVIDGQNYTTTFTISPDLSNPAKGVASGSQRFTASVCVELQDESTSSFSVLTNAKILDKEDPSATRPNFSYTGLSPAGYVSNNAADNASTKCIEEGVTGTFTYQAQYGSSLEGWTADSKSPDTATSVNVTAAGGIASLNHIANYTSLGKGSPESYSDTTTVDFNRVQSVRYGISPTTQTGSGNFTATELQYLEGWTDGVAVEDGQIDFNSSLQQNTYVISNKTISMTSTSPGYIYIIYRSGLADLTEIRQGATDVTSQYSVSTIGNYKVYVSNTVQDTGTYTFILNPS